MHEFALWAPRASKLAVKVDDVTYPMQGLDEHGWWRVSVDATAENSSYGFLIDDDTNPYPDPRSLWQPNGVHAPSQIYQHDAFVWTDATWQPPSLARGVIYELHVGTFTSEGTFDAAIARLPHLRDLGITHLELMPVAEFPGRFGWGYDGVSLFAVRHDYGGPDGLKRLVDACHKHGLAILLDVVYNHFGPVGNYTGKFAPYISNKHHTPWGGAINFDDSGSDEVRRFYCGNALMWLHDYHLDGLRLDAVHEIIDRSALHILEQLSIEVEKLSKSIGRTLVLIAESDLNDPRVVTPRHEAGYGMDAQWSDDFHHALFSTLNPEKSVSGYYSDFGSIKELAKSLQRGFVFDGQFSSYRQRRHGRPADGLSAHRLLGYIQNHDQVGNRAKGDRLEHIVGFDRAKLAAALVLTSPFIPMLFQGEEFAASSPFQYFADHEDPEMAKAVSEGRRRDFAAFGWKPEEIPDPEQIETFERSKLHWDEVHQGRHAEMLAWHHSLIALRNRSPSLNDGDLSHVDVTFDEDQRWLRMKRGEVDVILNFGEETLELPSENQATLLLASSPGITMSENMVLLSPNSAAILSHA